MALYFRNIIDIQSNTFTHSWIQSLLFSMFTPLAQ